MMNEKKSTRRSSVFLLELMIAILFFSVASAVCTQVFVKAQDLSREARTLSQAVTACSNAAEILDNIGCPQNAEEILRQEFEDIQENNGELMVTYEENQSLKIKKSEKNKIIFYDIQYFDEDGTCIYSLKLEKYAREVPQS